MTATDLNYFGFCPTLQTVLRSGEVSAEGQSKIAVHSGSTVNNLRVLRELVLTRKPVHTLEIGLAFGVSALAILATLRETGTEGYCHTAIDPFQTEQWQKAALNQIEQAGLSDGFRFMEEFSAIALPELLAREESFDLIYVDGSHKFDHVFVDYYYCIRLLRKGGVLLFDDCTTPDVAAVIKFARRQHRHVAAMDLSPYDDPDKPLPKKIANRLGMRQLKGFCKMVDASGIMM